MAIDLFRLEHGIEIENSTSGVADILVGDGLPGGDAGVQDAAPIGTLFLRTNSEVDGLQIYWKWSTANNSAADWKHSADKDYVDAVASGLSWREPVRVRDNTLYASSAAFPITGTIDGVALTDQDRVLFDNVTAVGEENVWIWDQTGTSWSEDTNAETDGDALLIQDGTSADEQWVYDGTQWVQFGTSTSTAELGYLRAFVGKTGPGSEFPTYSSSDVVTPAANLETAIGELDNAMGTGEITNDGGNYLLSDDMSWGVAGTLEVTDALNELNDGVGDRTYTNDNVVVDGESIAVSIDKLDTLAGSIIVQNYTSITTITNVDTLPLATTDVAKWIVTVEEVASPSNRYSTEIHALTDGTNVDNNKFSTLKLGTNINGLTIGAAIVTTNLVLQVTSTAAVNVSVKRLAAHAI